MKKIYSAPRLADLGDLRIITEKTGKGFLDAVLGISVNGDGTVSVTGTVGSAGCIPDHIWQPTSNYRTSGAV